MDRAHTQTKRRENASLNRGCNFLDLCHCRALTGVGSISGASWNAVMPDGANHRPHHRFTSAHALRIQANQYATKRNLPWRNHTTGAGCRDQRRRAAGLGRLRTDGAHCAARISRHVRGRKRRHRAWIGCRGECAGRRFKPNSGTSTALARRLSWSELSARHRGTASAIALVFTLSCSPNRALQNRSE